MKIHLFGKGKMGKMVESLLPQAGHELSTLDQADCCIDFSHPSLLFDHLKLSKNKGLVIGTTGWDEEFSTVEAFVKKEEMRVVYGANFSIGVHLLLSILDEASKKIVHFPEYDVAGIESHHNEKKDAPSGTAKVIERRMKAHGLECSFSSIRVGHIPGEHTLIFDSPFDTIRITHTARSRHGFAKGAIVAAEWIKDKKGFYSFEEVMNDIYSAHHSI